MVKATVPDRILLILTSLLAGYQIAIGITPFGRFPIITFTTGFGVLFIAGLLLLIFGIDALDSPVVVILSTIIPLSLSLGLVSEYIPAYQMIYLGFTIVGFMIIFFSRVIPQFSRLSLIVLTIVHGLAGLIIFILPLVLVAIGRAGPIFPLVSLGGGLIGITGLLLAFQKAGKPLVSRNMIFRYFPVVLFLMTTAFVLGFLTV
jgi:hypothetical protein